MAAEFRFSIQQRTFINYMFIKYSHVKVSERVPLIQRLFANEFPGVKLPCKATMFNMRKKYFSHGSLENRIKRSGAGPKRTVRTPENLDKVRNVIEQDMNKPYDQIANSARRNELNMRRSSWSRATQELGLSCYRYNIWLYS